MLVRLAALPRSPSGLLGVPKGEQMAYDLAILRASDYEADMEIERLPSDAGFFARLAMLLRQIRG